jgi:hypothetical protein
MSSKSNISHLKASLKSDISRKLLRKLSALQGVSVKSMAPYVNTTNDSQPNTVKYSRMSGSVMISRGRIACVTVKSIESRVADRGFGVQASWDRGS